MTRAEIAERIKKLQEQVWSEYIALSRAAAGTDYETEGEWPEKARVDDAIGELSYADEHFASALSVLSITDDEEEN
jgi:hypothetical protein